ncbi:IMP dehydrogenase [Candidatus Falkowbacteria bacterium RIFOXYD2_FULL_35_9]|uniref:IMP dehydrogenase n=1 Tax=Candidatus Falkowbacteria bacterium RIFOXYC2_FULL_36_12 TaxID=1798002 RepID=A0A1F5SYW1_9BACT|nr:MAG: IMP dehydrogenase [Candidatus Falkowbacteria bacterium RIFOXYC2_FULL_36_12]OGF46107.1 MAG: IMP dehydrogenase [Candidatus Falkowbacteria bacterium RIFOXYD2_FULL_35_9]
MEKIRTGYTYADVLLVPKKTPLNSRSEADVKTFFTKNIPLNIPLVSSNMATVTEHEMAISLAREGGLGIIHQFNTIEEQVEEVKKVKKSTSFVVDHPVTCNSNIDLQSALGIMSTHNITSLIVVDGIEVIGILTARDYQFETNMQKLVSSMMTPRERLITAEYGISFEDAKEILKKNRVEKLPLLENNQLKGLITTIDIKKHEAWPSSSRDSLGRLMVGAAVGVKDCLERARALVNAGVDVLVLDIAHAHSDLTIEKLKELKSNFPIDVVAGNIATADAAKDLILAGADGLKVGIGPSPVCTTRIISGSGVPQLTAIMDVVRVAKEYNIPVSADGGIKYSGDLSKAIAAGASTGYCGSIFSGTTESPGIIMFKDGRRYKRYMGSASYENNHERKENLDGKRYKQKLDIHVEGVSNLVEYKGPVSDIIQSMIKGLRSGISYCGARNIREMQINAEFIRITSAGWEESKSRGMKLSE